jgi:protein-S-isoprenylcysteine O-methyltransferase Ste14
VIQSLELKAPPPLVALAVAILMWGLAQITPSFGLPDPWPLITALALVSLGLGAAIAGVFNFHRAKTTIHPLTPERSTSLVETGIYRYSRNPMYLGMAMVLLAWSVWLAAPLTLLGPPAFMAFMQQFQIRPEERALAKQFGPAFSDYCQRVRRWL